MDGVRGWLCTDEIWRSADVPPVEGVVQSVMVAADLECPGGRSRWRAVKADVVVGCSPAEHRVQWCNHFIRPANLLEAFDSFSAKRGLNESECSCILRSIQISQAYTVPSHKPNGQVGPAS